MGKIEVITCDARGCKRRPPTDLCASDVRFQQWAAKTYKGSYVRVWLLEPGRHHDPKRIGPRRVWS